MTPSGPRGRFRAHCDGVNSVPCSRSLAALTMATQSLPGGDVTMHGTTHTSKPHTPVRKAAVTVH